MKGRALVEAAIAKRAAAGKKHRPIKPEVLADVAGEIPDALAAWLAWDTESPNGEVSLLGPDGLALLEAEELLTDLVLSESEGEDWEDDTREAMRELALQLPGTVLLLRAPCGEDHFLYLGPKGQSPVLVLEHEDLRVGWSGFDTYVGVYDGLLNPDDAGERAACTRIHKAIFG